MNTLRWIFIFPISIFCSIFFPFLYKQLVEFFISKSTFDDSLLLSGGSFFLQGIFFIVPAYFIAPKFKIQTLKLFLMIWILVVIFGDYYLYSTNKEHIGIWNSLLKLIGASLAYLNIILDHKDETIHSKQEKNINPTEVNRLELINRIRENASKNPEYKKFIEKKLLEKKEQIDNDHKTNTE